MNSKETLLLIPGFANNALVWQHQIAHLRDQCEIIVPVMDKYPTRREMVSAILKRAPETFILAGHSMGGWVAQAVAAASPQRVSKLILLNTWATHDPQTIALQSQICQALKEGHFQEIVTQHIGLLVHPSRLHDLPLLQTIQAMMNSFPLNVLIQQLEAMLEDYASLHLHPSIEASTLVVHSYEDALFPAKEPEAIAAGIRNAELAMIEGSGHSSPLEKPEKVTDLIQAFI